MALAGVHHRFDGKDHPRLEFGRRRADGHVADMRFAVKNTTDAVATVFVHDRKAHGFDEVVTCYADVIEALARAHLFDARPHTAPGCIHKAFAGNRGLADDEHTRVVTEEAVLFNGDVNVDDVAVFKNLFLARDAVADHVVDGNAGGSGVGNAVAARVVPQTGGLCLEHVDRVVEHELIERQGTHAGLDVRRDEVKKIGRFGADAAHRLDFFGSVDRNLCHGDSLSGQCRFPRYF